MKFDTIKDACQLWVERDMNQVPMSVVEKLQMQSDYTDITEITPSLQRRLYQYLLR